MPDVDLDESQLELFAQYVAALEGIGVNLQDERLRDTINAYPDNIDGDIALLSSGENVISLIFSGLWEFFRC